MNDKALGEKHNLEIIDIFNEDATMNSFSALPRKRPFCRTCRNRKELETSGALAKVEA
jgi:valyl-tRNA synthetase